MLTIVVTISAASPTYTSKTCTNYASGPQTSTQCTPTTGNFSPGEKVVCEVEDNIAVDTFSITDAGLNTYTAGPDGRQVGGWSNIHAEMFWADITTNSGVLTLTTLSTPIPSIQCQSFTGAKSGAISILQGHLRNGVEWRRCYSFSEWFSDSYGRQ